MAEILDKQSLKALSVETRQEIVKLISNRPYTASELAKILGKHVTTITEHLNTLEKSGLIRRKDDGHKWVYYVLASKGEKLFKPQFYSWIVVLSLSVVCLLVGASSFFVGGADYQAMEAKAMIGEGIAKSAAPAIGTASAIPLEIVIGIVLIILAVVGFGYVIWKYLKK